MKDRVERFVILPFSLGCTSQSSVAVAAKDEHKKPKSQADQQPVTRREEGEESSRKEKKKDEEEEESSCKEKMKDSSGLSASISDGIYRLIRSIKSFSQFLIAYKEETERQMEIGFPTDVRHVTHIGLDGTMTTAADAVWDNLRSPDAVSLPLAPFRHFELPAMAAEAHRPAVP